MIPFFSITISLIGFLLLFILFARIRAVNAELRLKKHRAKDMGFADLLNYASVVEDGIIVGKNGSFMAAWLYQGHDNSSSTEEECELVSFRINQALAKMGSGWMIHVDAVRRTEPSYSERNLSHFPDPLSKAIDEERRQLFKHLGTLYEGYFVITLTWFPPLLAQRKFVELMFDDDAVKPSKKTRTVQLIDTFKQECLHFESHLSGTLSLERLKSEPFINEDGSKALHDNFLRWLHFCITGMNHPINLPNNPMYIDNLIGGQEVWTGVIPKIGRKFVQCVAIEGFPFNSHPGILTKLTELPVEYRWSSRFIFLDTHEALSHLEKFSKKWKQKIRGFFDQLLNRTSGNINKDAVDMVNDVNEAIAETNSGLVTQGYYTTVVVLMDEHRELVENAACYVAKAINDLGFTARIETINTMDAFMGTLPGHGVENIRRPLLHTLNLADLMPTSTLWTGENKAPSPLFPPLSPPLMHCVTNGNAPFRLNLHVRDNGHALLFGPTRSGKSTLLSMIALSWRRYPNARIFAFDKGMSMYPTCKGVGGAHFTIAAEGEKLAFAPLQFLETPSQRAWALEWIDTILTLNGLNSTPNQRNEIANALNNMHQSKSKTMSEFCLTLQDETLREALKQYTVDGLVGYLLDAEEDSLHLSDFMTFELEHLMRMGEKYALPVLLYLFHRIEESLDGRPTLISCDEAWLMLAHKTFRSKIAEWLDSMAKKNCSLVLSTQHPSHAANSGIMDSISSSTAVKIYLPNPDARTPETAAIYKRLGINSNQINIIATAQPKRDYFYVSEKGSRMFNLALGPLALSFAGATDMDSITRIKTLESQYGATWIAEWLHLRGINFNDYLENHYGVAA
ncbi:VirB4 family type IV secretion/conjugal transfer ATPase [Legionella fairfieldensis]|uniref:VirB4 family type IV secretion/conjugal transfer ATPase n=1 Tax=Legionella fairfieldensis TaxID=45064 RepID=UPI00048CB16F|nr:VirB4 family type IV secretion/conjugal transfer ATPase [Legionella fairfieldensis]